MGISRTTFLLALLGLSAVIVAGYFILVRPEYDNVQRMRGEVLLLQGEIDRKTKIFEEAQKLIGQYDDLTDLRTNVAMVLPFEREVAHVMAQLILLMKKNNLSQESMAVENAEKLPALRNSNSAYGYAVFPVRVEGAGTYEDVKRFIRDVESNMRLMDLDNVSLSATTDKATQQNITTFSATINMYYQLDAVVQPKTLRGGTRR